MRKLCSLRSPLAAVKRRPSSLENLLAADPKAPWASTPKGRNWLCCCNLACFAAFFLLVAVAAPPGPVMASCRLEGASESTNVASQIKHLPCFHGKIVIPSGRFPFERQR
ncbi:hypothetical protein ACOME3_003801 [Neoechinorhynchus agilis]